MSSINTGYTEIPFSEEVSAITQSFVRSSKSSEATDNVSTEALDTAAVSSPSFVAGSSPSRTDDLTARAMEAQHREGSGMRSSSQKQDAVPATQFDENGTPWCREGPQENTTAAASHEGNVRVYYCKGSDVRTQCQKCTATGRASYKPCTSPTRNHTVHYKFGIHSYECVFECNLDGGTLIEGPTGTVEDVHPPAQSSVDYYAPEVVWEQDKNGSIFLRDNEDQLKAWRRALTRSGDTTENDVTENGMSKENEE